MSTVVLFEKDVLFLALFKFIRIFFNRAHFSKMKNSIIIPLLIIVLTSFVNKSEVVLTEEKLLGKWNWEYAYNSNGTHMSIKEMSMGLSSVIQTEFKKDGIYKEYKSKLGSDELTKGGSVKWWRIAGTDTLMFKSKDYLDFKPIKVIVFESDSMVQSFPSGIKLVLKKMK